MEEHVFPAEGGHLWKIKKSKKTFFHLVRLLVKSLHFESHAPTMNNQPTTKH
jgi:hypothetical protein